MQKQIISPDPITCLKDSIHDIGFKKGTFLISKEAISDKNQTANLELNTLGSLDQMKYSELMKYRRGLLRRISTSPEIHIFEDVISWYCELVLYFMELKFQKVYGVKPVSETSFLTNQNLLNLHQLQLLELEDEYSLLQYFPQINSFK